ncbi:MAG: single-stranded DNA-binding protein [Anaerolineales bacterium]
MYQTIILIGNLGKDPEMRFTPGGQPVTTLSVATNRRYNGQNGQPVKETTWFRVTVWGKQAESCNEFLHKGSKVLVEGRLTPDPETGGPHIWENNGKVGASFEVTASTVRFLSGREDQDRNIPEGEEAEPTVNTQVPPNVDPSEIPF